VPVSLERPQLPRLLPAEHCEADAGAAGDERIDCEVRLALPLPVSAATLAGWRAGLSIGEAGPLASLWRLAGDGAAQCLALGRLMPWGDGWALAIEALRKPPRTRTRGMTAPGASPSASSH
jgi:hypothetical protein